MNVCACGIPALAQGVECPECWDKRTDSVFIDGHVLFSNVPEPLPFDGPVDDDSQGEK